MFGEPFPRDVELEKGLQLRVPHNATKVDGTSEGDPTVEHIDDNYMQLPGQPCIPLSSQDPQDIANYLFDELLTPDLDRLAPHLWLVGIKQSSHISTLHQQLVKGRNITITENPELHCTWIYDRVFIKPVPATLLSWAFWQYYILSDASPLPFAKRGEIKRAAMGFLRTYHVLIKHRSDFRLAKQHNLLPERTTFEECCAFFSRFGDVSDSEVSPRYEFGELRLGRLNFWAKVFLKRFTFQKVQLHYGYNTYFTRFYGPMLFLFAFFSVVLSAMQVGLTVDPSIGVNDTRGWKKFESVCSWFSVFSITCASALFAALIFLFMFMAVREISFAVRTSLRNKRHKRVGSMA